jgi:hypothetical protein
MEREAMAANWPGLALTLPPRLSETWRADDGRNYSTNEMFWL